MAPHFILEPGSSHSYLVLNEAWGTRSPFFGRLTNASCDAAGKVSSNVCVVNVFAVGLASVWRFGL